MNEEQAGHETVKDGPRLEGSDTAAPEIDRGPLEEVLDHLTKDPRMLAPISALQLAGTMGRPAIAMVRCRVVGINSHDDGQCFHIVEPATQLVMGENLLEIDNDVAVLAFAPWIPVEWVDHREPSQFEQAELEKFKGMRAAMVLTGEIDSVIQDGDHTLVGMKLDDRCLPPGIDPPSHIVAPMEALYPTHLTADGGMGDAMEKLQNLKPFAAANGIDLERMLKNMGGRYAALVDLDQ